MKGLPPETSIDLKLPIHCESGSAPRRELTLRGDLIVPANAAGVVLFAHGSGSGRKSSRNRFVAAVLQQHGIGTLLFDLLTEDEEIGEAETAHLRFDIPLLAQRLVAVTHWTRQERLKSGAGSIGYFGASTGAAAALIAAAQFGDGIRAVVSRGGRPDLADHALPEVASPTLLIVGSRDYRVVEMNRSAWNRLNCEKEMQLVEGATHLFEEPGTLELAANSAAQWFLKHLGGAE